MGQRDEINIRKCRSCGENEFYKDGRCKNCQQKSVRRYQRQLWLDAIRAYGSKCQCCFEDHYEFLVIDHISGGGGKERKKIRKSGKNPTSLYRKLKSEGYPAGYRVLCHNCNFSLGVRGYCPHTGRPDTEMIDDFSRDNIKMNN